MTIVLALSARGPSQLIRPMIDHHLAQGVQRIVITFENAQADPLGYMEAAGWADRVTVGAEPRAGDVEPGGWLLHAGADEFWVATDRSATLADALGALPPSQAVLEPAVLDLGGYADGPTERRAPRAVRVRAAAAAGDNHDHGGPGSPPVPSALEVIRVPASSAATSAHIASLELTVQRYASRRLVRLLDTATPAARSARRRVADALRRRAALLSERRRRARLAQERRARYRAMRRLLDRPIEPVLVTGRVRNDAVPLVMCLWNRPQRIGHILDMLAAQTDAPPLRLILWNNNPADTEHYRAAVTAHATNDALASVELYSSPHNIGGIARFVVAHTLFARGVRGAYVMLDDDQNVGESFIHDLLTQYRPHGIRAWWAYRNEGSYWNRFEIEPGDEADYAGTGGTVADIEIAADRSFFDIDPRYLMLEDQWMTHYARLRGWDIRKARVSLEQVLEETNQYHGLLPLKDEFYAFLRSDAGRRRGRIRF